MRRAADDDAYAIIRAIDICHADDFRCGEFHFFHAFDDAY